MKNSDLKVGQYLEYYNGFINICYEITKIDKFITLKTVYSNHSKYKNRVGDSFEYDKHYIYSGKMQVITKEKVLYYKNL